MGTVQCRRQKPDQLSVEAGTSRSFQVRSRLQYRQCGIDKLHNDVAGATAASKPAHSTAAPATKQHSPHVAGSFGHHTTGGRVSVHRLPTHLPKFASSAQDAYFVLRSLLAYQYLLAGADRRPNSGTSPGAEVPRSGTCQI